MADIIETSSDAIRKALVGGTEERLSEALMPGDERRIYADALSYVVAVQNGALQRGFDNLDPDKAEGDALTALGAAAGVARTAGRPARIFLDFMKAEGEAVTVPAGAKVLLGGVEWLTDADATGSAGASVQTTATQAEASPPAQQASAANGLTPWTATAGTMESAPEGVTGVSTAVRRDLYVQRAVADDREDDAVFKARVKDARTPKSYAAVARGVFPDAADAIEYMVDAGRVGVTLARRDDAGLPVPLTTAENESLTVALQDGALRYLGDSVQAYAAQTLFPRVSVKAYCRRGTKAVLQAAWPGVLLAWCRERGGALGGEFDASDLIRLLDSQDGVRYVDVTSVALLNGAGRTVPVAGTPPHAVLGDRQLLRWAPTGSDPFARVEVEFEEVG